MDKIFAQEGVYYHATLPMSWHAEPAPSADNLSVWMHDNVTLLRALATVEALQPEKEIDQGASVAKVLERLEFKIDLTLNLIAKLLTQNIELPPVCPLLITTSGIEWLCAENAPIAGEDIIISAYISPKLPQPLMLPAHVAAVRDDVSGIRVYATFTHINEEAQEWLSRTVFRYHRRAIQTLHQG